jgi:N-sulfoglucosamine sulfohydrolase
MNKIELKYISILAILTTFSACKNVPENPNIVWLIAEDLSPDLGCYGNSLVSTPNIDKLAFQGIRFTNAFATCPVCSPSRSGFITGMYQTSIGADHHDTMEKNKLSLPEGVSTLPDILYDAGYYIDYNGKTHFNFKYEGADQSYPSSLYS